MSLTSSQKERLTRADEIIQQTKQLNKHFGMQAGEIIEQSKKNMSQQPRFEPGGITGSVFMQYLKWTKDMLEHAPVYQSDSRNRDAWLSNFWKQEPYISGVINSVVQIDRNRGWSLVGGRNQVLRFSQVLHNWQVAPGQMGWRSGVGAGALSFYTTDIGFLGEIGRQFKNGPMAGMFHLDPTQCKLTGDVDNPVTYFPRTANGGKRISTFGSIPLASSDVMRVNSMTSIDESMNGLGYCGLSRAAELAITMTAVWQHEQEMLFARAPKGLLLLRGINEQQWKDSMAGNEADLDALERQWFGNVAVFASGGDLDIDAKIFMLSNLPEGFDQKVFTDLLMYGYALCFGYDAREFWPVSSGSLGTATETNTQHAKAITKGGVEYWLGLQEQIQANLPETIHFEADARDPDSELQDAQVALAKQQVINAMYETGAQKTTGVGLIDQQQALELMAEQNLIPRDWTEASTEDEATDVTQSRKRCLEYVEVQQAIDKFPDEPIVQYRWPQERIQVLYPSGKDALNKSFVFQANSGKALYKSGDVEITSKDVDAAIARAKSRVGPELAGLLEAKNINQKPVSKQSRFTGKS